MSVRVTHGLLVNGTDRAYCAGRVMDFFARTPLVRYDRVDVDRRRCLANGSEGFDRLLQKYLRLNQERTAALVRDLAAEGFATLDDLIRLPQGYPSKLLHTLAHLCDGFFGIDAAFYDLDESSCQLGPGRHQWLAAHPGQCWLITVQARVVDDGLARLRRAGILPPP